MPDVIDTPLTQKGRDQCTEQRAAASVLEGVKFQIDHHEPIGQMLADRSYHVRGPLAPQYSTEGKMDGLRGGQGGIGDASLQ